MVLIPQMKTVTPSDGRKAHWNPWAYLPLPPLPLCPSALQPLPLPLLPPSNPKELQLMESAQCKVAINPALPQIVDAGSAGGYSLKNHPPKAPIVMAPVAPPMVIPPPLLPSAAPVPLGPIAHPLLSGHDLAIPSSQQLPLHHTLPISPTTLPWTDQPTMTIWKV